jgi:hypothetical protein
LAARFTCPCCGFIVFEEPPGSYDTCPVCAWEDDLSQLRWPTVPGGANRVSLAEAQLNFMKLGRSDPNRAPTRSPAASEQRDVEWRPLDLSIDRVEASTGGHDMGETYDDDRTAYYYWRHQKE